MADCRTTAQHSEGGVLFANIFTARCLPPSESTLHPPIICLLSIFTHILFVMTLLQHQCPMANLAAQIFKDTCKISSLLLNQNEQDPFLLLNSRYIHMYGCWK